MKLKPFIQRSDGSAKGDWDVGITIDAMEYSAEADVVVLASGDGDFALLVEKIKHDSGVSVEVYGVTQLTANALIHEATKFVPIEGKFLLPRK